MEQPAGLLSRMAVAWDTYDAARQAVTSFEQVPTAQKSAWAKQNPRLAQEYALASGLEEKYKRWQEKKG